MHWAVLIIKQHNANKGKTIKYKTKEVNRKYRSIVII